MSRLVKREVWRPTIAGEVQTGGARGFHLPQRPDRRKASAGRLGAIAERKDNAAKRRKRRSNARGKSKD